MKEFWFTPKLFSIYVIPKTYFAMKKTIFRNQNINLIYNVYNYLLINNLSLLISF